MRKYEHLRKKAVALREKGMSLGDICERLAMKKGTVYYWIRDVEVNIQRRVPVRKCVLAAAKAVREKHKRLRDEAYEQGRKEASELLMNRLVRDFVVMYMGEGVRRERNKVGVSNSNPVISRMSYAVLRRFSKNKIGFRLQVHEDHDEEEVRKHWASELGVLQSEIKVYRKTNDGKLEVRNWRLAYGTMLVYSCDTLFRSRLQGWIDWLSEEWNRNLGVA